jgi:REP element-mobilizing transposase RayT
MQTPKSKHGGKRKNAGRKYLAKNSPGCAHRPRFKVHDKLPLHINFRYKHNIRNKTALSHLRGAIQNAQKHGLRVIHYALLKNHVHLVVEAPDNQILTRGMRSLTITIAKRLKRGRIQIKRYHLRVCYTKKDTKQVINYVLFNEQKHTQNRELKIRDYCSLMLHPNYLTLIKEFETLHRVKLQLEPPPPNFLSKPVSLFLT